MSKNNFFLSTIRNKIFSHLPSLTDLKVFIKNCPLAISRGFGGRRQVERQLEKAKDRSKHEEKIEAPQIPLRWVATQKLFPKNVSTNNPLRLLSVLLSLQMRANFSHRFWLRTEKRKMKKKIYKKQKSLFRLSKTVLVILIINYL